MRCGVGNHDHTHGITAKPTVPDRPTDDKGEPNFKPGAVRGHDHRKFDDDAIYSGRRGFRPAAEAHADSGAFQRSLGVGPAQCISHATYLQDSGVEVKGWRIFGCPWHGLHPGHVLCRQQLNWDSTCFEYDPATLDRLCQRIPHDTDVLLTHAPPRGFLDVVTVVEELELDESERKKQGGAQQQQKKKRTRQTKVHCGEIALLKRLSALKDEAESAARQAGAERELWPASCHIFGHVHATQFSPEKEEIRFVEHKEAREHENLEGSVFVNAASIRIIPDRVGGQHWDSDISRLGNAEGAHEQEVERERTRWARFRYPMLITLREAEAGLPCADARALTPDDYPHDVREKLLFMDKNREQLVSQVPQSCYTTKGMMAKWMCFVHSLSDGSLGRWQLAGLNVGRRRRVGRCAHARAQRTGPFPTFLANKAGQNDAPKPKSVAKEPGL